jgi:hypothetical protein
MTRRLEPILHLMCIFYLENMEVRYSHRNESGVLLLTGGLKTAIFRANSFIRNQICVSPIMP